MTDPKTLREIAEQACIFDRTHFADGNEPTAETLIRHHASLPTDPKLVTRLVPRYAVALGFFEGYAKAVADLDKRVETLQSFIAADGKRTSAFAEWEQTLFGLMGISSNHEFPRTAALAWARDRLAPTERQNIGIVKKPPPPPPAASPKPEEISDELAQAAAEYANDQPVSTGIVVNRWLVRSSFEESRETRALRQDAAVDFVNGAQWSSARTNERIREYEARIDETEVERLAMKEERDRALAKVRAWEARTGEMQPRIVESKLSIPSDEEIGAFVHLELYKGRNWTDREIAHTAELLREDESGLLRGVTMYNGYRAEACAVKLAFLHFAKRNGSAIVESKSNELSTEIDDDLAKAAAKYTNIECFDLDREDDVDRVRAACARPNAPNAFSPWGHSARSFVNGARWQLTQIERAHLGDDPTMYHPPLHATEEDRLWQVFKSESAREAANRPRQENETHDEFIWRTDRAGLRAAIEASNPSRTSVEKSSPGTLFVEDNILKFKGASGRTTIVADPSIPTIGFDEERSSLIFRDDNERDFWDDIVHGLNRRTGGTSRDMASAADEMVEERRARIPKIVDVIQEQPTEVTDELLLEAASWANSVCDMSSVPNDLVAAKSAMNGNVVFELRWSNAVRSYVNGALRKHRKA